MKRQGITLPERRAELYQKFVETWLSSWNRARGLGRPPTRDLDVLETLKVLAPLALWMHEVSPGVGLADRYDLLQKLTQIFHERHEPNPDRAARRFLEDIHKHTGLLLERGPGQYGFIHLTFEEYLAAIALAELGQQSVMPVVAEIAKHLGDHAGWQEVSLLTVSYMGIVQRRDEAAGAVIEALLSCNSGEPGEAVILAGKAVVDASPAE
jgi:predicted NACHT family NTPase